MSGPNIRFGLAALKGVGQGFTGAVLAEREKNGPFASFQEFCSRLYDCDLNKRVLDSLIRSGCFDSLGCRRSQLIEVYEQVVDTIGRDRRKNLDGQFDLFGGGGDTASVPDVVLPNIPEFSPAELMAMEKETTGLYLSGHPMDQYRRQAEKYGAVPISVVMAAGGDERSPYGDGAQVTLAGVVASVRTKTTKSNSLMAYVMLEDATGSIELLCFSRTLTESGAYLKTNLPVVVTGRVSVRDEKAPQLMVDRAAPLSSRGAAAPAAGQGEQVLWIRLPDGGEKFTWLKKLMTMFPGDSAAIVYLEDRKKKLQTRCVLHGALLDELRETLGEKNVVLREK